MTVFAERSIFIIQIRDIAELSVFQYIHLAVGVHDHQRLHRFKPLYASYIIAVHTVLAAVRADLFRLYVN